MRLVMIGLGKMGGNTVRKLRRGGIDNAFGEHTVKHTNG